MSEIITVTALDVLQDRNWHWIPRAPEGGIRAGTNIIWFDGGPTDHYPIEKHRDRPGSDSCWRVEFATNQEGTPFRGWDTYVNIGHVTLGEDSAKLPAFITNWPSPEFMGHGPEHPDSSLFIRAYGIEERPNPFTF